MARGQSLLETVVAVGILLMIVTAVFELLGRSFGGAAESRARLEASYLAAEGIEVIRATRDSNWLRGKEWNGGLTDVQNDGTLAPAIDPKTGDYLLDFYANKLTDAATQFHEYATVWTQHETYRSEPAVSWYRLVTLNPICLNGSAKEYAAGPGAQCPAGDAMIALEVTSDVAWSEKGTIKTYRAVTRLYVWK